ncbi:hypothetical protein BDK51DRAFT_19500, partial [Blyttiomyces helicus]
SRWTIRARVLQKSKINTWKNQRGAGTVFKCLLVDESGEIGATGFNEATRFYNLLVENKVYYISKASIKPASAQYNKAENDYEMSFNDNTVIELECVRRVGCVISGDHFCS